MIPFHSYTAAIKLAHALLDITKVGKFMINTKRKLKLKRHFSLMMFHKKEAFLFKHKQMNGSLIFHPRGLYMPGIGRDSQFLLAIHTKFCNLSSTSLVIYLHTSGLHHHHHTILFEECKVRRKKSETKRCDEERVSVRKSDHITSRQPNTQ